ncbi:MAG: S-layer homology domain-containing protein [Oscillospiraceae bacterium]|nr:S-layer homology domain-containing protein [Oscillospiraceae bacterium]
MKKLLTLLLLFSLVMGLFLPTATAMEGRFTDVSSEAWYYEGVSYVEEKGLMNGTTSEHFSPNTAVSRAMMVTVLWRLAGEPKLPEELGAWLYWDIPSGTYYELPAFWAKEQELMLGYSVPYDPNDAPGGLDVYLFRPDDALTREQLATLLYRYAKWQGMDVGAEAAPTDFSDEAAVSPWAAEAMQWCIAKGLIRGTSQNGSLLLNPKGYTTRAQLATILLRLAELQKKA